MKRSATLYNIIMPVWLLLGFIPYLWPVVLLGNYAIDSLVLYLGMKWIGLAEKKPFYKAHIGKVWGCGFLGDLPGVLLMLLPTFAQEWLWQPGAQASQNALWHFFHDQLSALLWNPFANAFSALWALLAVGVSGVSIYWLNRKLGYRHTPLEPGQAKRLSLLMAALTAPWLFLLPASWLY